MSISIPDLLEGILEATAAEAAAKARIVAYRGALEDEARRRHAADGAAPSWNAPELGKVRLEPAGAWSAVVADPAAFASWVAEHYPTEATATITVPAEQLGDVLEAIAFVLPPSVGGPDQLDTRLEVRSAWATPFLAKVALDVEAAIEDVDVDNPTGRTVVAADPTTGVIIPGIDAARSAAKLVVSLDRGRRTAVVEEARTSANAAIADAIGEDQAAADLAALDVTRRELEALHGDQLASIAKAHGLGSSGTKAALAERIARAEHATGKVVRPAAALEGTVHRATSEEAPVGVIATEPATPADDDRVALDHQRPAGHREPYVGQGADGARRSARIDREEVDGLDQLDPRVDELLASAERWDAQAAELEQQSEAATPVDPYDAVEAIKAVGSREVLRAAAKARQISAAGTKDDVAARLVEAGVTPEELTP